MYDLREWAIKYAQLGFSIFPLMPKSKIPATPNGFKNGTTDLATILEWWDKDPNYNIGICTGEMSNGLVVIDLDVDESKGINGVETLKDWEHKNNCTLPKTVMSITGRNGYHFFYRSHEKIGCKTGLFEGIDIRGDGGYVVAPPSIHPNGRKYEWQFYIDDIEIQSIDSNVSKFLGTDSRVINKTQREVQNVIQSGSRNDQLFRLASSLQAKGLSDSAILYAVIEENKVKCVPPLSENEVIKIVHSAFRYDKGRENVLKIDQSTYEYPDIKQTRNGIRILPTIENFKVLISKVGINIQYDVIKREIEITCSNSNINRLLGNENKYDHLITICMDYCIKENIAVNRQLVAAWIEAVANENTKNAIIISLSDKCRLTNDETSNFKLLMEAIEFIDNIEFSHQLFQKWLIQCIALVHNENGEYGGEGVLCIKGPQGIGKTSLFRNLGSAFGHKYFKEGSELDSSKDKLMENTAYWITELGEFKRTSTKEIDFLKAFITNSFDEFRSPYMRKSSRRPRLTSFCATVNDDTFLKDTENRRFWIVEVKDINLEKINMVNYQELWYEIDALYRKNPNGFRLSKEEREQLNRINTRYQVVSNEEQLIDDLFDWNQEHCTWTKKTATQVAILLGNNISPVKVGKALKKRGYSKNNPHLTSGISSGKTVYLMPNVMKDYKN